METKTYSSFSAAWAAVAGTLPVPPGLGARPGLWTVVSEDTRADASASPEAGGPLAKVTLEGGSNRVLRRAVISAVDPLPLPTIEEAPYELPAGAVFVMLIRGEIKSSASTRAGFDCTWFREVAAGKFAGDAGLALQAVAEAAIQVALSGDFLAALTREGDDIRLRVFRRTDANWLSATMRVAADLQSPLPEKPEDLVRALLGVHYAQWLQSLVGDYGAAIAAKLRIAQATLNRALDFWRTLDNRLAAVIWGALGDDGAIANLREWMGKIAAMDTRDQFTAALKSAAEGSPAFLRSPAAAAIEAISGSVLGAITSPDAWKQLRNTAARTEAFLSEAGVARALSLLHEYAAAELGLDKLEQALEGPADNIDEWLKERAARAIESSSAAAAVAGALALAKRVYSQVADAIAKKLTAELNWRAGRSWRHEALVDATFAEDEKGVALYLAALGGDTSALFQAVLDGRATAREAVLTHGIGGETSLQLRLPFLTRSEWSSRWESLATARIETGEQGRIVVYTVESVDQILRRDTFQSALALTGAFPGAASAPSSFTISYTDKRTLKRAEARVQMEPLLAAYRFPQDALEWLASAQGDTVETELTVSAPGDLAAAWLRAPRESDPEYFDVYSAVSTGVQRALRVWLPYVYFSDVRRYENLGSAWPLMVYQSTRPFPGRAPCDFTYDIMDIGKMRLARQSVSRALAVEMQRVAQVLFAAGRRRASSFYRDTPPAIVLQSVECQPVNFNALVSADTTFVHALIDLGRKGRESRDLMANDPDRAVRTLSQFATDFTKTFHRRLKRLYGGNEFAAFGALLLAEATRALASAVGPQAKLAGILRLKCGDAEKVFTNEAFEA